MQGQVGFMGLSGWITVENGLEYEDINAEACAHIHILTYQYYAFCPKYHVTHPVHLSVNVNFFCNDYKVQQSNQQSQCCTCNVPVKENRGKGTTYPAWPLQLNKVQSPREETRD